MAGLGWGAEWMTLYEEDLMLNVEKRSPVPEE